jgi:hypothetical protein
MTKAPPISDYAMIELIERAKADLELHAEIMELIAQARMIEYKAHLKAGFTEEQALFLIINGVTCNKD